MKDDTKWRIFYIKLISHIVQLDILFRAFGMKDNKILEKSIMVGNTLICQFGLRFLFPLHQLTTAVTISWKQNLLYYMLSDVYCTIW